MIKKELEKIVEEERKKDTREDYIRNILKEYLQVYVLSFIYTSPSYNKKLIFTGGTCLRHFYGLGRLSEDIDFDYVSEINSKKLMSDLYDFFEKKYKYSEISISLKQKDKQVLIKFPVLKDLGLAYPGGSELLYVKMDISEIPSKKYSVVTSTQNRYGFNYIAKHYDLPDLMAGKLHAILTRRFLRDKENRESLKGRDYFDLLWFVNKGVRPNIQRLSDMLNEKISMKQLEERVDEKVNNLEKYKQDFKSDLSPLITDPEFIKYYIENYREEYFRNKTHSFS